MKIISFLNYKGGVGKTTLTANVAGELAYRGKKVLLLDLDPQCSLTFSFITPDEWERECEPSKTLKHWFEPILTQEKVQFTSLISTPKRVNKLLQERGSIDIITGHLDLLAIDVNLAVTLGAATPEQAVRNFLTAHCRLHEGINSLDATSYDYVLIDCPPNLYLITKNALVISHYIVIPARPDYLSTLGIDHLQRSVGKFSAAMNHILVKNTVKGLKEVKPQVAGVVFSMVNTLNSEPIAAQNLFINNTRRLGIPVFNTFIRENNSFFASVTQNLVPIVLAKATHPAHSEVVREIVALTDEIVAETNRLAK